MNAGGANQTATPVALEGAGELDEPAKERLGLYLQGRDQARRDRQAQMWAGLSDREQRLVRETAVLAFVHGALCGRTAPMPPDTEMLARTLQSVDSFADLYPTLASLGRT